MATVRFTPHLYRFFPDLRKGPVKIDEARTIAELVAALNDQFPGIAGYITEDSGRLRQHVTIYVGQEPITDSVRLRDTITDDSEVFVFQALSGG